MGEAAASGPRIHGPVGLFLRLVVRIFFRRIEVVGRELIPPTGPLILVGNHPNSLVDPLLIGTTCGRRLRFVAKDTLFEGPVAGRILSALGGVPIRRRTDHPEGPLANQPSFSSLESVLGAGGAFAIFPEGISHSHPEIQPLRTGTARIAIDAARTGREVAIVPCGLSYFRRNRMRSRVLVRFGAPIRVPPETTAPPGSDADTVRTLTRRIEEALREVTINAPDFETLRTLEDLRRLVTGPESRLELSERTEATRRVIDRFARRQEHPEVEALYGDVARYRFHLDALGIEDGALDGRPSRSTWAIRVVRHLFLVLVLAPLALPGSLIHAPVLALAVLAGEQLNRHDDVVAATKLFAATAGVLAAYGAIGLGILVALPFPASLGWATWTLGFLALSGWATIRVLERQSILRRALRILLSLARFPDQLADLRRQRSSLRARALALLEA